MNIDAISSFIQKYDMLPEGARVLCAVSGGADSVCLLHFLSRMEGISLVAAHYNHCLRGGESDRDEAFVRNLCDQLGILCVVGAGDVKAYAKSEGLGIEEAARSLRYAFLQDSAREHNCSCIATAHNATDNAETVIMNLARGTGLKGLCGIPPKRGNIIRPLLETGREEIEEYLRLHGLEHVEDSSNAGDEYSRNRVRHHVLPVLESINPAYAGSLASALDSLREDEEYLSGLAKAFIEEQAEGNSIPVSALLELSAPVQKRVIRLMHGGQLGSIHVKSIISICLMRSLHAHTDVPGMRVTREFDRLVFGAEAVQPLPERVISPGESIFLPELGMRVSCRKGINNEEVHKSLTTFIFKSESICGRMSVASRREGDKICLQGRGCTKSLKKLFSEEKLSIADRLTRPVIYDEAGPVAVYGFGIARRCAACVGDEAIIIEIEKDEGEKQWHER